MKQNEYKLLGGGTENKETACYDKLVKSHYESVYATKFVVLRDRKILEYYINRYENKL